MGVFAPFCTKLLIITVLIQAYIVIADSTSFDKQVKRAKRDLEENESIGDALYENEESNDERKVDKREEIPVPSQDSNADERDTVKLSPKKEEHKIETVADKTASNTKDKQTSEEHKTNLQKHHKKGFHTRKHHKEEQLKEEVSPEEESKLREGMDSNVDHPLIDSDSIKQYDQSTDTDHGEMMGISESKRDMIYTVNDNTDSTYDLFNNHDIDTTNKRSHLSLADDNKPTNDNLIERISETFSVSKRASESSDEGIAPSHFQVDDKSADLEINANSAGVKVKAKPASLQVVSRPGSKGQLPMPFAQPPVELNPPLFHGRHHNHRRHHRHHHHHRHHPHHLEFVPEQFIGPPVFPALTPMSPDIHPQYQYFASPRLASGREYHGAFGWGPPSPYVRGFIGRDVNAYGRSTVESALDPRLGSPTEVNGFNSGIALPDQDSLYFHNLPSSMLDDRERMHQAHLEQIHESVLREFADAQAEKERQMEVDAHKLHQRIPYSNFHNQLSLPSNDLEMPPLLPAEQSQLHHPDFVEPQTVAARHTSQEPISVHSNSNNNNNPPAENSRVFPQISHALNDREPSEERIAERLSRYHDKLAEEEAQLREPKGSYNKIPSKTHSMLDSESSSSRFMPDMPAENSVNNGFMRPYHQRNSGYDEFDGRRMTSGSRNKLFKKSSFKSRDVPANARFGIPFRTPFNPDSFSEPSADQVGQPSVKAIEQEANNVPEVHGDYGDQTSEQEEAMKEDKEFERITKIQEQMFKKLGGLLPLGDVPRPDLYPTEPSKMQEFKSDLPKKHGESEMGRETGHREGVIDDHIARTEHSEREQPSSLEEHLSQMARKPSAEQEDEQETSRGYKKDQLPTKANNSSNTSVNSTSESASVNNVNTTNSANTTSKEDASTSKPVAEEASSKEEGDKNEDKNTTAVQNPKTHDVTIEVSKSKSLSFNDISKGLKLTTDDKPQEKASKKTLSKDNHEIETRALKNAHHKHGKGHLKVEPEKEAGGGKKNTVIVNRPPVIYHPPPEIYHRPAIVLHRPPILIQRPSIIYHQPPVVVHRPAVVYRQPPLIFHQPPPVVHQPMLRSQDNWMAVPALRHVGSRLTKAGVWTGIPTQLGFRQSVGSSTVGTNPLQLGGLGAGTLGTGVLGTGVIQGSTLNNQVNDPMSIASPPGLPNDPQALDANSVEGTSPLQTTSAGVANIPLQTSGVTGTTQPDLQQTAVPGMMQETTPQELLQSVDGNNAVNAETATAQTTETIQDVSGTSADTSAGLTTSPVMQTAGNRKSFIHKKKKSKKHKLKHRTRRSTDEDTGANKKGTKKDVVVNRPPIIYHPPPEIYHRPDIVIHRPPIVIHRPPIIYHQPPVIVHRPAVVYHQPPIVFHQPPPAVQQPLLYSHDTFVVHPSFVAQHLGSILRTAHHYVGPPRLLTQMGEPLFQGLAKDLGADNGRPNLGNIVPDNQNIPLNEGPVGPFNGLDNAAQQVPVAPVTGEPNNVLASQGAPLGSMNPAAGMFNSDSGQDEAQAYGTSLVNQPAMINQPMDGAPGLFKRSRIEKHNHSKRNKVKKGKKKETLRVKQSQEEKGSKRQFDGPEMFNSQISGFGNVGPIAAKSGNRIEMRKLEGGGRQIVVHRPGVIFHPPPEVIHRPNIVIHRAPLLVHRAPIVVHQPPVIVHRPPVFYHQPDLVFNSPPPLVNQPYLHSHDLFKTVPKLQHVQSEISDAHEEVTGIPNNVEGWSASPFIQGHSTSGTYQGLSDQSHGMENFFRDQNENMHENMPNNDDGDGKTWANSYGDNPEGPQEYRSHLSRHDKEKSDDNLESRYDITKTFSSLVDNEKTFESHILKDLNGREVSHSAPSHHHDADDDEEDGFASHVRSGELERGDNNDGSRRHDYHDDTHDNDKYTHNDNDIRSTIKHNLVHNKIRHHRNNVTTKKTIINKRRQRRSLQHPDMPWVESIPLTDRSIANYLLGAVSPIESLREDVHNGIERGTVKRFGSAVMESRATETDAPNGFNNGMGPLVSSLQTQKRETGSEQRSLIEKPVKSHHKRHHVKGGKKSHIKGGKKQFIGPVDNCYNCGDNCAPSCYAPEDEVFPDNGNRPWNYGNSGPIPADNANYVNDGPPIVGPTNYNYGNGINQNYGNEFNGNEVTGNVNDYQGDFRGPDYIEGQGNLNAGNYQEDGYQRVGCEGSTCNPCEGPTCNPTQSTVYHRPPIVVPQPPDVIHHPQIVIHRKPIVIRRRPIVYHQKPIIVHKPPVVVHQAPIVIHPQVHHHRVFTQHVNNYDTYPVNQNIPYNDDCSCRGKKNCVCDVRHKKHKIHASHSLSSQRSVVEHHGKKSHKKNSIDKRCLNCGDNCDPSCNNGAFNGGGFGDTFSNAFNSLPTEGRAASTYEQPLGAGFNGGVGGFAGANGVVSGTGFEGVNNGYNGMGGVVSTGYDNGVINYGSGVNNAGIVGGYENGLVGKPNTPLNHDTTVYKRPDIIVPQPPDIIHRPDIVIHRAPIIVHRRPIVYHQAPVVVHKPPVVVHQAPIVVHPVVHHHRVITHHVHDYHIEPTVNQAGCSCDGKKDCICDKDSKKAKILTSKSKSQVNLRSVIPNAKRSEVQKANDAKVTGNNETSDTTNSNSTADFKTGKKKKKDVVVSRPPIIYHPPPEIYHRPDIVVHRPPLLIHRPSIIYHQPPVIVHRPAVVYHQPPLVFHQPPPAVQQPLLVSHDTFKFHPSAFYTHMGSVVNKVGSYVGVPHGPIVNYPHSPFYGATGYGPAPPSGYHGFGNEKVPYADPESPEGHEPFMSISNIGHPGGQDERFSGRPGQEAQAHGAFEHPPVAPGADSFAAPSEGFGGPTPGTFESGLREGVENNMHEGFGAGREGFNSPEAENTLAARHEEPNQFSYSNHEFGGGRELAAMGGSYAPRQQTFNNVQQQEFNGAEEASHAGGYSATPFENGPVGHLPGEGNFAGQQFKRDDIEVPRARRSIHKNNKSENDDDDDDDENKSEKRSHAHKKHKVVVARPDIVYHQAPEIVHRPPIVVHRPDIVIRRPSVVVHRPPVVVHRPAIVYHQPPVIFNTPGPVVHQPQAVSHDMYVTHNVPEHVGSRVSHVGGVAGQVPVTGQSSSIGNDIGFGDATTGNAVLNGPIATGAVTTAAATQADTATNAVDDNSQTLVATNQPIPSYGSTNGVYGNGGLDGTGASVFNGGLVGAKFLPAQGNFAAYPGYTGSRVVAGFGDLAGVAGTPGVNSVTGFSGVSGVGDVTGTGTVTGGLGSVTGDAGITGATGDGSVAGVGGVDGGINGVAGVATDVNGGVDSAGGYDAGNVASSNIYGDSFGGAGFGLRAATQPVGTAVGATEQRAATKSDVPKEHHHHHHHKNKHSKAAKKQHVAGQFEGRSFAGNIGFAGDRVADIGARTAPLTTDAAGFTGGDRFGTFAGDRPADAPVTGYSRDSGYGGFREGSDVGGNRVDANIGAGHDAGFKYHDTAPVENIVHDSRDGNRGAEVGSLGYGDHAFGHNNWDNRDPTGRAGAQTTVLYRPDVVFHPRPELYHRPDIIVHRPDVVIHRPSVVIHQPPVLVHRPAVVFHQPPILFHQPQPIVQRPQVVSHDQYVQHDAHEHVGSKLEHGGTVVSHGGFYENRDIQTTGTRGDYVQSDGRVVGADDGRTFGGVDAGRVGNVVEAARPVAGDVGVATQDAGYSAAPGGFTDTRSVAFTEGSHGTAGDFAGETGYMGGRMEGRPTEEHAYGKSTVVHHKKKKSHKKSKKVRRSVDDVNLLDDIIIKRSKISKKKKTDNAAKKHHVTVIHRPDVIFHQRPEIIHRPDIIVHRPDVVINRPDVVIHRPAVIVHKPPMVIRQSPIVFHQTHPLYSPGRVSAPAPMVGSDLGTDQNPCVPAPTMTGCTDPGFNTQYGNGGGPFGNFGGEPVGNERLIGPIGFAPQVPDTADSDSRSSIPKKHKTHKHKKGLKKNRVATIIRRPDIVFHQRPEVVNRPDVVVHRPDVVIHRPPVVVSRPPTVVRKPPLVIHQQPIVFNQPTVVSRPVVTPVCTSSPCDNGYPVGTVQGDVNVPCHGDSCVGDYNGDGVNIGGYAEGAGGYASNEFPGGVTVPVGGGLNGFQEPVGPAGPVVGPGGIVGPVGPGVLNGRPYNDTGSFEGDCGNGPGMVSCGDFNKKHKVSNKKLSVKRHKTKEVTGSKRHFSGDFAGHEGGGFHEGGFHHAGAFSGHTRGFGGFHHGGGGGGGHHEGFGGGGGGEGGDGCEGDGCGGGGGEGGGEGGGGGGGFSEQARHAGAGVGVDTGFSGRHHFDEDWGGHDWGHGHGNTWEHHNDHEHHHADEQNIVVQRPDIVFHPRPELYHRPDIIVHRPDIVIHRPSVVIHQPPVLVHRPAVIYHQPPVVFHQPGPVVHRPRVVSHDMYVTHDANEQVGSQLEHADGGFVGRGGYYEGHDIAHHEETHEHEGTGQGFGGDGEGGGGYGGGGGGGGYGGGGYGEGGTGHGGGGHGGFRGFGHTFNMGRGFGAGGHGFGHGFGNGHSGFGGHGFGGRGFGHFGGGRDYRSHVPKAAKVKDEKASKKHRVVVFRPPIIYHPPPEIYHRADLIVHRPDVVISRPSVVVHRPDVIVHRPNVVYHQPPVVFYTPPPSVQQPIMNSHDAYVTKPSYEHVGSRVGQTGSVTAVATQGTPPEMTDATDPSIGNPNGLPTPPGIVGPNMISPQGFTGAADSSMVGGGEVVAGGAIDGPSIGSPAVTTNAADNSVLNGMNGAPCRLDDPSLCNREQLDNGGINGPIMNGIDGTGMATDGTAADPAPTTDESGFQRSTVLKKPKTRKSKKSKKLKKAGKSRQRRDTSLLQKIVVRRSTDSSHKKNKNKKRSKLSKKDKPSKPSTTEDDQPVGKASKKNDIVVKRPPVIYHPPPEIYHRPPIIVHRPPLVIRRPPIIYHQPPVIVHRPAVVYHQPPLIFHQPPPAVSQPILKSHDTFMMHPAAHLTHMGSMVTNAGTYVGVPEHRFMYQGGMGFFHAPQDQGRVAAGNVDQTTQNQGIIDYSGTAHQEAAPDNGYLGGMINGEAGARDGGTVVSGYDSERPSGGYLTSDAGHDQLSGASQAALFQDNSGAQMAQGAQNVADQQMFESSAAATQQPQGVTGAEGSFASENGAYGRTEVPYREQDGAEEQEDEEDDNQNNEGEENYRSSEAAPSASKRKSIEKPKAHKNKHKHRARRQINMNSPYFNTYPFRHSEIPSDYNYNYFQSQPRRHHTTVNVDVVGKRSVISDGNHKDDGDHFLF